MNKTTLVNPITGERRAFDFDGGDEWFPIMLEYLNCIRAGWIHDEEMSVSEVANDN